MGTMIELRRQIITSSIIPNSSPLPAIYEQIPYISMDGNQVIRSPYIPTQYDEFHVRFNGINGTLFSAGNNTYQTLLLGGFSGTGWYCKYFSSTTYSITPNYTSSGVWYDIDIDGNDILTTNNKTYSVPYQAELDGTATDLYLFERRNWSSRYTGSVSEFWIKNNGVYKMYLIPCIRKNDQKVGMYDTVSKTFFTSARNDFIAGT